MAAERREASLEVEYAELLMDAYHDQALRQYRRHLGRAEYLRTQEQLICSEGNMDPAKHAGHPRCLSAFATALSIERRRRGLAKAPSPPATSPLPAAPPVAGLALRPTLGAQAEGIAHIVLNHYEVTASAVAGKRLFQVTNSSGCGHVGIHEFARLCETSPEVMEGILVGEFPLMPTMAEAIVQIVLNHYEPEESAAAGRPMFSDTSGFGHEFAVMGLEEFAERRGFNVDDVRRILRDHSAAPRPPLTWARRPTPRA